jgi:hypothetical protein
MLVSAEIRWFWRKTCPPLVAEQFHRRDGESRSRTDIYLRLPGQSELGIKRRGSKPGLEIKGLVALRPLPIGLPASACQLWCKWSAESKVPDEWPQYPIAKTRWLRHFGAAPEDGSQQGCQMELTKLEIPGGDIWWTLGFEASGAFDRLVSQLTAAVGQAGLTTDAVRDGHFLSYPAWIEQLQAT